MAKDEDFDELLAQLERRANRLLDPSTEEIRQSSSFGRLPSVIAASPGAPKPGEAIGENYEVVRVLGRTESSNVLLVRHKGVDRLFAMKLLPQELARDKARVARFQDEARATSMIGHENIVFVTDFGRSNRFGLYFVMEYLDGETLAALLDRDTKLSVKTALAVAVSIGSALAAVHELGIVHRDVRPENIMSHQGDGEPNWKLFDFGLSTQVVKREEAFSLFEEPSYVAPEIAAGDPVDATSDQFSLAAVLYHMLTNRRPWPNRTWTTATPDRWTPPEPIARFRDDIGEFVDGVLMKALDPRPQSRFQSVEHFVASFQRATGQSRKPTIPPIDAVDAERAAQGQYAAASVAFDTEEPEPAPAAGQTAPVPSTREKPVQQKNPPSVQVLMQMIPNARPKITMDFLQVDRLRREWRRNLITGGVFVPSARRIEPGTPVIISLRFALTGQEAAFSARVIDYNDGGDKNPAGLAIEIDEHLRGSLHKFLFDLDLGLLDARSIVRPLRDLDPNADLSADEAFFLSRLSGPTLVGTLRGIFASLPIDLDDIASGLQEKGWVAIEGEVKARTRSSAGRDPARTTIHPGQPSTPESESKEFVRVTLQRADFFRSQGNFLAEIETLELGAVRTLEPELYYRAALTRVQFLNDFEGAIESMRKACDLAPNNPKYAKSLYDLERLKI